MINGQSSYFFLFFPFFLIFITSLVFSIPLNPPLQKPGYLPRNQLTHVRQICQNFNEVIPPLRPKLTFENLKSIRTMTSKCPVKDKCVAKANSAEYTITMCRHGESEWNQLNLFCGWYNAALSQKGHEEAKRAGRAILDEGLKFDVAYASVLRRSQDTLRHILEESGQTKIPIYYTWKLNERHYGGLTGQNKLEAVENFGEEQVAIWRRSYDIPPPPMEPDHPYYNEITNDPIYKDGPPKERFPATESLKLCIERSMPFWNETIIPQLKAGKSILIAAHGNSLRGIVKNLDRMTPAQIMNLNLPTGIPFQYKLDGLFKPIGTMRFLGDPETVRKAIEDVANQTKKK